MCRVCIVRPHDVPCERRQQQGGTEMFAHSAGFSVKTKQKRTSADFFTETSHSLLQIKFHFLVCCFFDQNNLKHFRNVLPSPSPDVYQHLHPSSCSSWMGWMGCCSAAAGGDRTPPRAVPSCPPSISVVLQQRAKPPPSSRCRWVRHRCQSRRPRVPAVPGASCQGPGAGPTLGTQVAPPATSTVGLRSPQAWGHPQSPAP